jgi:hypothetical protein
MAKVNVGKLGDYKDSQQKGGEFLQFPEGETLVRIHPPCRDGDKWEPTKDVPFVPLGVHYSVGKGNNMVVSLDPDDNPIIAHPFVEAELKKQKKRLTGKDPTRRTSRSSRLASFGVRRRSVSARSRRTLGRPSVRSLAWP